MRGYRWLFAGVIVAMSACGLSELGEGPPAPARPGGVEAGTTDGGLTADGPPSFTTDSPAPPGCVPSGLEEICTDGIDNDCNGAIDCADTACVGQGFACIPAVPNGWTVVAADLDAGTPLPTCPPRYDAGKDFVLEDEDAGGASCGCQCVVGAAPTCASGMLTVYSGDSGSCSGTGQELTVTMGQCTTASAGIGPFVRAAPLSASGGSCQPVQTNTIPPEKSTRTCATSSPVGKGCPNGGACVFAPTSPFSNCIEQAGDEACAGAYTTRHLAAAGVATDTRSCTPCECTQPPSATCTGSALLTWSTPSCPGNAPGNAAVNGQCNATSAPVAKSFEYSATMSAPACDPTPTTAPQPSGSVTYASPETICCAH